MSVAFSIREVHSKFDYIVECITDSHYFEITAGIVTVSWH